MGRKKKGSKGKGSRKSSYGWVKPTLAMILGGGVGLLAMGLLPDSIAPFAPALGVVGAKFIGGGGWGKYLTTAGVVGGVTFLSYRPTVQAASAALAGAKRALTSGGGGGGVASAPAAPGTAAEKGAEILRNQGIHSVR